MDYSRLVLLLVKFEAERQPDSICGRVWLFSCSSNALTCHHRDIFLNIQNQLFVATIRHNWCLWHFPFFCDNMLRGFMILLWHNAYFFQLGYTHKAQVSVLFCPVKVLNIKPLDFWSWSLSFQVLYSFCTLKYWKYKSWLAVCIK